MFKPPEKNKVLPVPTANLPWTLSTINSLVLPIEATVNLALIPKLVDMPRTSPTVYPSPPLTIVAATATPPSKWTLAVASLPLPVIVDKATPIKPRLPDAGV